MDDLKKTRGKENAREKVAAVKEEVKPSKKPKAPKADKENKAGSGQVATEKNRTAEESGPVSVFAGEKIETVTEGKVIKWFKSTGDAVKYQIVGEDESDIKEGRISVSSPIARALIGKEEGDTAEVQAPGGIKRYEIVAVHYL